uniref:DUF38 domain-containing protein n=1 Tax=Panagrolaimus sp. JU765 TaxID=591449 RepID=A0AC34RNC0_9BILA
MLFSDRLLNPVHLSFDLHADVFNEVSKKCIKDLFLIGKEAVICISQVLRNGLKLEFSYRHIYFESVNGMFQSDSDNFSKKLVQLFAPYVTEVSFNYYKNSGSPESHHLFFEALSKDQKQKKLTIVKLRVVNEFVIEAVKKLNEKNIPVTLHDPVKELFLNLPGLHFEELSISKDWYDDNCFFFEYLTRNHLPCTFRKLNASDVHLRNSVLEKENVILDVEEVSLALSFVVRDEFVQLKKKFPNAKKLTIRYIYGNLRAFDFQELWNEKRNCIEDAPQQEIIANFQVRFDCLKRRYQQIIVSFDGEKIDENTFRWTSSKNKFKMLNLM